MKLKLLFFLFFVSIIVYSQQYDSVFFEKENIDTNNEIYKLGSVFIYDYIIKSKGKEYKLKVNGSKFNRQKKKREIKFEFSEVNNDSLDVARIHLIVQPVVNSERPNENQTKISFLQEPKFASISTTGVVENEKNIWIHPIRKGFFNALETAPFPYVKKPFTIGYKWTDQMNIGENWGNELWGEWSGDLLLTYTYKVMKKEAVNTQIGKIDCFVVESTAESRIGTTKLRSYFSEKYGFVKMEYKLLNDLEVVLRLVDYKENKEFNDMRTFFKTKKYLKN